VSGRLWPTFGCASAQHDDKPLSIAYVRQRTYINSATGETDRRIHDPEKTMFKYGLAWLLGVPLSLLVVVYVIFRVL